MTTLAVAGHLSVKIALHNGWVWACECGVSRPASNNPQEAFDDWMTHVDAALDQAIRETSYV